MPPQTCPFRGPVELGRRELVDLGVLLVIGVGVSGSQILVLDRRSSGLCPCLSRRRPRMRSCRRWWWAWLRSWSGLIRGSLSWRLGWGVIRLIPRSRRRRIRSRPRPSGGRIARRGSARPIASPGGSRVARGRGWCRRWCRIGPRRCPRRATARGAVRIWLLARMRV